ncbi:MAG: hypothetical protein L6R39_004758 [Caloplaca ligustica]|nr:MAG: hypothetical protein L6R39_004758 [Caloplaca ligustica]
MPQAKVLQSISPGQGWRPLQDSPNNPPLPPDIWVPNTPTPQPHQSGNDTPTSAIPSTGSWRERRRTGELVERPRPPRLSLYIPDSEISTSPEIQSSPEWESTLERLSSPDRESSSKEPASSRNPERPDFQCPKTVPELRRSSSYSSNDGEEHHGEEYLDPDDPPRPPPRAKNNPYPSQVDGAPDERGSQRGRRHRGPCKKLCKSLRSIPSQLTSIFNKEKKGDAKDENSGEAPKSAGPEAAKGTWWSTTSKRFGKAKGPSTARTPGRNNRKTGRKSLRGLFSSSGAADETSSESRRVNPFDDPSAPQAFGAPTHEEDTSSPVEPEVESETERYLEEATSAVEAQRRSTVGRQPEVNSAQATSGDDSTSHRTLDGNQDEGPRPRGTWHRARAVYQAFLEVNGWGPVP